MKHLRHIAILLYCLAYMAFAENVTLTWDANPVADSVVSYTVVYGATAESMDQASTVKGNSAGLDLPPGRWTFAVYATNDEGTTSALSATVSTRIFKPAPGTPGNVKLIRIPLQGSRDKKEWKTIAAFAVPLDKNGGEKWKFFRAGPAIASN